MQTQSVESTTRNQLFEEYRAPAITAALVICLFMTKDWTKVSSAAGLTAHAIYDMASPHIEADIVCIDENNKTTPDKKWAKQVDGLYPLSEENKKNREWLGYGVLSQTRRRTFYGALPDALPEKVDLPTQMDRDEDGLGHIRIDWTVVARFETLTLERAQEKYGNNEATAQ